MLSTQIIFEDTTVAFGVVMATDGEGEEEEIPPNLTFNSSRLL